MKLVNATIQDLESELERRKQEKKEKPQPLEHPDFSEVIKMCRAHVDDIANNGYADEEDKNYIFEGAIEAVFGKEIWEWIRGMITKQLTATKTTRNKF